MSSFHCSIERPWGIHPPLRNDEDCRRCGWTAPGPVVDALADAQAAAAEAVAAAAAGGWIVHRGAGEPLTA